jgi:hypothetical protein
MEEFVSTLSISPRAKRVAEVFEFRTLGYPTDRGPRKPDGVGVSRIEAGVNEIS